MKIDLNINTEELQKRCELTEKNLAYAVVNGINDTAREVQRIEQRNVAEKFTIRKPDFMMKQAAIIKPFASVAQGRPFAEIAVGQKPRLLLSTFEAGGVKTPFKGSKVAVPITGSNARPGFDNPVPENLWVSALNLKPELSAATKAQRGSIRGANRKETSSMRKNFVKAASAGQPWQGNERTYMIPGLGIFQRSGSGKGSGSSLLYKFVPSPQLKPRLGFVSIAQQFGQSMLRENVERQALMTFMRKG